VPSPAAGFTAVLDGQMIAETWQWVRRRVNRWAAPAAKHQYAACCCDRRIINQFPHVCMWVARSSGLEQIPGGEQFDQYRANELPSAPLQQTASRASFDVLAIKNSPTLVDAGPR